MEAVMLPSCVREMGRASMAPSLASRALGAALVPVEGASLAFFRFAFGILIAVSALRFVVYGWVDEFLLAPKFVFSYWGTSFITRPTPAVLFAMFGALFLSGIFVALGLFYRAAIGVLFLLFTYIELIDVTNYLNHYYLVSLLAFLLLFMPLGDVFGIDAWRAKRRGKVLTTTFPAWMLYLLRFQVAIVYFYAGVAKFTSDWLLHAQPLNLWLSARTSTPLIGPLLDFRAAAYAFSWFGFVFDTTIAGFLLYRRTRPFAYGAVVFFHLMTSALFPIGMFPFIMMVSALVFFSPDWPLRVLARWIPATNLTPRSPTLATVSSQSFRTLVGAALVIAYCVVQVLLPLRHRLYGGNVLWHEQGMRFSWKVMVREKNASVTYRVHDPRSGRDWEVQPRSYLVRRQEREFGTQPDLVLRLAHVIHDDESARVGSDVEVRVDAFASLNGRAATRMIDPTVDLARVEDGLLRASWILPEPAGPPPHLRSL